MRAKGPVAVGVVGLGSFGRLHALTLAGIGEAEIVAAVDRSAKPFEEIRTLLPGASFWTDIDHALVESPAEAWVVASSTSSHVTIAERILQAGKPVLVEKPIAQTLADAEKLKPLVKPDSGNFMMGHIVLFNTEFGRLLSEVRRRPPLKHISGTRHRPARTLELYPGENPFHLVMVHDLYSVLALVDRREPVDFAAQARWGDGNIPDLVLAQLVWDDGLLASLSASFLTPDSMADDGYDRMEVFGDGWASRIDPNPRPFTVWDDQTRSPLTHEIVVPDTTGNEARGMLAEELRAFCRVVRGVAPVPVGASYYDALTVERWLAKLEACVEVQHG